MLEWNVYVHDFNAREIKPFNVFSHYSFLKDCKKAAKKYAKDKAEFSDEVRKHLAYYYWSKCEWEIILSPWTQSKNCMDKKIDVYSQVMLNWEQFIDYLWERKAELKKMDLD